MVLSEITAADVAEFLRLDDPQNGVVVPIMTAAKQFIMDYTGLSAEDLDTHEDFYIAFMVLCQDMYDNRAMYVDKGTVNKVVESILFRHRTNFV